MQYLLITHCGCTETVLKTKEGYDSHSVPETVSFAKVKRVNLIITGNTGVVI